MGDEDRIVGNKANVEDDEEEAVTMLDVLQDEADLEDDVKAVLGAADDKNCTYPSGGFVFMDFFQSPGPIKPYFESLYLFYVVDIIV